MDFYASALGAPELDPLEVILIGRDTQGPVAVYQIWRIVRNGLQVLLGGPATLSESEPKEVRIPDAPGNEEAHFVGQRRGIIAQLQREQREGKRFFGSEVEAIRLIGIEAKTSPSVGGEVDVLLMADAGAKWHTVKSSCR